MAREIDRMPSRNDTRTKYPWDAWLNGKAWELAHGTDFAVNPKTLVSRAHAAARYRGMAVTTTVRGDVVFLQAYRPGDGVPVSRSDHESRLW